MKYKYSRDDIHKSETFDLKLYGSRDVVRAYKKEVSKQSESEIISAIYAFIELNKISSFYACTNEIRKKHPEWYPVFQSRYMMFKCYLDSKEKQSKFGNSADLEKELEKSLDDYINLQSKVYQFLSTEYPEIELDKLNTFFASL